MDKSIGQNLKQIRKKLGIRQHELNGEEITRNLISLIENDKTPLHERVAKLIANNMNEINEKREVNIYIDYKDLLYPERFKAKEKADVLANRLKTRIQNKNYANLGQDIDDIEHFFEEWCILEKKAEIYELLGDIFYEKQDRINEYSYYTKAFESCFSLPFRKKKYELVLKLGASCIALKKYEEAIRLNNLAINSFDICSEKVISSLYYNNAVANKKMNRYGDAFAYIQEAEKNIAKDEYTVHRTISILKGNCYKDTKQYDEAIKIYNTLIPMFEAENDYEHLCIIYMNLIDAFKSIGKVDEVKKYKAKVIGLIGKIKENSPYIVDIFFELSLICKFLDEIEEAEKYLLKALKYSELNMRDKKKVEILLALFDIYYSFNNIDEIRKIDKNIVQVLENHTINDETRLLLKLILFNLQYESAGLVKNKINILLKEENK